MTGPQNVDRMRRTLRLMWLGMAVTGLPYAAVLWLLRSGPEPPSPPAPGLGYGIAAAGLAASVGSFALRPLLLSPRRIAAALDRGGWARAQNAIVTGHSVLWALADSCAVVGLLLGVLGASATVAYGLVALGTALVLGQAPGAHTVSDLLDAAARARARDAP